ncbi:hypothetical protein K449DRAFT_430518 [Hypoxylon sp. EC38]|nr:hypothetical protein K449DRAFT_430518 [Hypoxylon sp. EC38]
MAPKYVGPEALGGRVAYGACRENASELIITGRSSIRGLPEISNAPEVLRRKDVLQQTLHIRIDTRLNEFDSGEDTELMKMRYRQIGYNDSSPSSINRLISIRYGRAEAQIAPSSPVELVKMGEMGRSRRPSDLNLSRTFASIAFFLSYAGSIVDQTVEQGNVPGLRVWEAVDSRCNVLFPLWDESMVNHMHRVARKKLKWKVGQSQASIKEGVPPKYLSTIGPNMVVGLCITSVGRINCLVTTYRAEKRFRFEVALRLQHIDLAFSPTTCIFAAVLTLSSFWPASHKAPPIHKTLPRLAFGLLKGNPANTAPAAVSFVSDQDFSLRKTFHIINLRPPPPASTEVA